MPEPFVQSNYPRVLNDDYQTIDDRCLRGLLETWDIRGIIGDPCHMGGRSELVKQARFAGYDAFCVDPETYRYDDKRYTQWLVTNPPYSPPPLLNSILETAIALVNEGKIDGAAFLLRSTIDHGKLRAPLFDTIRFAGCIKLRFRPWWSEERTASPIHNFSWFIWQRGCKPPPKLLYWGE